MNQKRKIAVIGCGYWGKNLIRNYFELGCLYSVCDNNPEASNYYSQKYHTKIQTVQEIVNDKKIDGVVIASPPITHMELACKLLEANKNIFIEKPLCMDLSEANTIHDALKNSSGQLMVGHLLHYHPGYRTILDLVREEGIENIKHISSSRCAFGRIRSNEDVLWSFAPHDISMILGITQSYPLSVNRIDSSFVQKGLSDISYLSLDFGDITANIHVSWMHPSKEQKLIVTSKNSILIFDDTLPWSEKVSKISYEFSSRNNESILNKSKQEFFPLPEDTEPLKLECQHFISLINKEVNNITDINEAINVIKVLEVSSKNRITNANK